MKTPAKNAAAASAAVSFNAAKERRARPAPASPMPIRASADPAFPRHASRSVPATIPAAAHPRAAPSPEITPPPRRAITIGIETWSAPPATQSSATVPIDPRTRGDASAIEAPSRTSRASAP